jgi:hypothetical protein
MRYGNRVATADESALILAYWGVLSQGRLNEPAKYLSNFTVFQQWNADQRLEWIYHMERQAKKGLPFAQELVGRAAVVLLTQ